MNPYMPRNRSGESLDEFRFTFEYFLDHATRIEADVSPQRPRHSPRLPVCPVSLNHQPLTPSQPNPFRNEAL